MTIRYFRLPRWLAPRFNPRAQLTPLQTRLMAAGMARINGAIERIDAALAEE